MNTKFLVFFVATPPPDTANTALYWMLDPALPRSNICTRIPESGPIATDGSAYYLAGLFIPYPERPHHHTSRSLKDYWRSPPLPNKASKTSRPSPCLVYDSIIHRIRPHPTRPFGSGTSIKQPTRSPMSLGL
ncbi:hypothetical protein DFH28DRAFT_1119948 [Melampsora americana]|nr:hypothetical protein DFH28DRAFT_1119948 [Melampsora americana]